MDNNTNPPFDETDLGDPVDSTQDPSGRLVLGGCAVDDLSRYPDGAPELGRAQAGRHRKHVFPARPHRVAPSFTAEEYAAVVAAAARVGLTPTGFCARAALTVAETRASADSRAASDQRLAGESVEALAAMQAELADARTAVVRVGTNLNQAVTALHATGETPAWLRHVVEACGQALRSVDEAASRIHGRLP